MGASARSEATRSSSRIGTPASGSTWERRSTSVPTISSNTSCRGNADGVDVEPIHVDHSAPAAYGFLVHTSGGTIAYTGDLRQHGPHSEMTKDFIDAAKTNEPIALITEGTRVTPADPRANFTEA